MKAHFESGFGAQRGKLPTPTVDLMRDVLSESHRRHLPLLLHANSLSAHRFAVSVGVDAVLFGIDVVVMSGRALPRAELDARPRP